VGRNAHMHASSTTQLLGRHKPHCPLACSLWTGCNSRGTAPVQRGGNASGSCLYGSIPVAGDGYGFDTACHASSLHGGIFDVLVHVSRPRQLQSQSQSRSTWLSIGRSDRCRHDHDPNLHAMCRDCVRSNPDAMHRRSRYSGPDVQRSDIHRLQRRLHLGGAEGHRPPVQSTGGSTFTFQFPGPGTYTVTVSIATQGCANPTAADSLTVKVPPCTQMPPDTPPPPPTTTTSPWCSILLVLAIVLLLLGALVVIVGVCINVFWVWIVGAAIGVVGFVLFVLWLFLCAAITPCSLILTMYCLLDWWVKVVAPVILVVAAIFGGVPCGLAALGAWAGWGALLSWYTTIMFRVGCPPIDCTARRAP